MAVYSSRNTWIALVAFLSGLTGCASGGGASSAEDAGLDVSSLMAEARDVDPGVDPRETDNTDAAQDHLEAGDDAGAPAEARQHYGLALQSAQAAVAEDPQNPLAHRLAAYAHLALEDFRAAAAAFDQAAELRPIYEFEDIAAREAAFVDQYQEASPFLGSGEYEQAAVHLENADAVYGRRPEAKITLAQIYASLREHDQALQKIDEIDAFFASDQLEGVDEQMVADWRAQVEPFPLMRAQILADAGRFEEAASAYRTVVARDPGDLTARQDLAVILMQTGETEQALEVYRDLAMQPGLTSDGLTRIGLGLYQADQYAESAAMLERAADRSLMDRDAIEWWARALLADSAWTELQTVAQRWLELDPMSGQGHAILAQGANQAGNTQVAAGAVQVLQEMEYSVDNLQLRRNPNGGGDLSGSITNRTLSQGEEVTLVFTFYAENGRPIGNAMQTVSIGAEGMSEVFQLQFSSAEQVGGYSYEPRTP